MRLLPGIVLLLLSSLALAADKVEPDVRDALAHAEPVRVLVVLADDATQPDGARRAAIAARVDATLAALPAARHALKRRFVRVPALALEVDAVALERLAALPHVERIGLDAGGFGAMAQSAPLARVTDAFSAGLDASGAKIAIVDSGLRTTHADFSGRIIAQQCFCSDLAVGTTGCCPNGQETMSGVGSAEDDHGHGTNVSGIAAGGGAAALRGAAPAASIVAVKVLDAGNSFCCASDVVAAFDWVLQNHPDTDVVNASLGTNALFATACDTAQAFTIALAMAVNNLVANGTMVFASSGNNRSATSITAPACLTGVVAVGAVWDANLGAVTVLMCTDATTAADQATCFTNSNALVDLYAPGARVTSSGRSGATATSTFSGTSQATPLASGCATALRAEFPTLPLAAIEAALEASPTTIVDAKSGLSFPRLDCAAAALQLANAVFADGFE